jgi:carboxymethylenebutenolidase
MALEQDIQISLPDGITDAVLIQPETAGKWPGILYFTDIGGIRPAQRQAAQRLANEGYLVLLPNVFYRTSKPPVMDMPAMRANPELFFKRIGELAKPLTPEAQQSDLKAYINFLSDQPSLQDKNKLGAVGFCFCGAVALRAAATCPDQVVAAASFHGGNLYENNPNSPHLLLPQIKARLLFGHAVEDKSMPAAAIQAFEDALKAWGGQYESETYEGARHGWTTLDNPAYNPAQASRAYEKLKALFAETLVPSADAG